MDIGAPGHLDVFGGVAHIYALLAVSLKTFESEFQRCGMRLFSERYLRRKTLTLK